MYRALANTQPWRFVLLAGALTALAIIGGARWHGTEGAVALVSLAMLVVVMSVWAPARWVWFGIAILATGLLFNALLFDNAGYRFETIFIVILSGVVAVVTPVIRNASPPTGRRRDRDLGRQQSTPRVQAVLHELSFTDNLQEPSGSMETAVQFPVLLETLEDIGRLISMNLDLDTLVPAIISTAKTSLKCGDCEVYLWNSDGTMLVNALGDDERESSGFVPQVDAGVGAWVIRERTVWTRTNGSVAVELQTDPAYQGCVPDAVAPLTAGGDLLGLLVLDRIEGISANLERMLSTLANIYGLGIKNAYLFRRVEEMARRDGLTGLYNHTTFQRELPALVQQAAAKGTSLSLVMSDVDFFKNFNDDFGHQAGDDVLRELARLWKAIMPDSAVLARYGGEEFIAALPGIGEDRAVELAELLRSSIEEYPFLSNGHELQVTASFGVTELAGGKQSADDFVRTADQCLYASKRSGRNQVTSHSTQSSASLENVSEEVHTDGIG